MPIHIHSIFKTWLKAPPPKNIWLILPDSDDSSLDSPLCISCLSQMAQLWCRAKSPELRLWRSICFLEHSFPYFSRIHLVQTCENHARQPVPDKRRCSGDRRARREPHLRAVAQGRLHPPSQDAVSTMTLKPSGRWERTRKKKSQNWREMGNAELS